MLKKVLEAVLVATVAAAGAVSPAFAQSKNSDSNSVHTNGGRSGAADPYTDGAKSGKFDPYTDGAKKSTKSNLKPAESAAKVGDPRSPYADGAKSGKADPFTDGAKTGKSDPYTDGAKKP